MWYSALDKGDVAGPFPGDHGPYGTNVSVQIHGRRFTWDAVAARLLGLFDEALRRPRGRLLAIEGEGADPIGLAPRAVRPPPGAGPPSLEKIVRAVIDRPSLKQRLSPAGSRRQQVARSVITQAAASSADVPPHLPARSRMGRPHRVTTASDSRQKLFAQWLRRSEAGATAWRHPGGRSTTPRIAEAHGST